MGSPVFEEFDPESDCDCPGCVSRRRTGSNSPSAPFGGRPAAHRVVVVATAAAAVLGAAHAAPALAAPQAPGRPDVPAGDEPETPQGGKAPLHGPAGQPARPGGLTGPVRTPPTTRADIIRRAREWVSDEVPYSMDDYWYDGYRQDCSGFVSMAWNLSGNEWTGSLHQFGTRIAKEELQPGDILLFHNPSDPEKGSHVVVFGGWTDYTHSYYLVYEQTRPTTRRQSTPYAYWSHSDRYVPYRYKGLTAAATSGSGAQTVTATSDGGGAEPGAEAAVSAVSAVSAATTPFPGRAAFGPGADNRYVTQLGRLLVERGGARFYASGPGPRWSASDGWATMAFQQAQGWRGADADGIPGPRTWALLTAGRGRDIDPGWSPGTGRVSGTGTASGAGTGPGGGSGPGGGTALLSSTGTGTGTGAGTGKGTGSGAATGAAGSPASSSRPGVPAYPGRVMFRPGARNAYVTRPGAPGSLIPPTVMAYLARRLEARMNTTTSPTPEPEGPSRPTRLIQNEQTTEIPVHLLFRDEPEPRPVPLGPAVVGSRAGTGEQPRLRRPAPAKPRPVAQVDPDLAERRARVLPGAAGVFAGLCGAAGCVAVSWWAGTLPTHVAQVLRLPAFAGAGLGPAQWAAYAGAGAVGLFGFGGLARGRTGRAWVLGLFGRYRGTVRRTGLLWVNPLLLRRRVDVRLRHWRSEPLPAADGSGVALRVVALVVWRVRDTVRATLGVEDHETYLRECVEAALARVPVEAPGAGRGSVEAAGEALTRQVALDAGAIGLEVFAVRPLRIEYAPEVAAAMNRRRIAALDARHRASVLTSVVDSVEDTVTRLTMRGLVELDDYERKALVKDLTVAFCAGRGEQGP